MARERVLIVRADATREMGSGHLVRSTALAQAWRQTGGRAIVVARVTAALPSSVEQADVERRLIDASHPAAGDLEVMLPLVETSARPWVVCDGYHFDAGYTAALRARGARVLVVDDIADAPAYDADVILNQNIFSERFAYPTVRSTRMLCGPSYALLRPEFAARRAAMGPRVDRTERLLVTMGGGDPFNQTEKVLRAIGTIDRGLDVRVIVGNSNDDHHRLERAASALDGFSVEFVRNPGDMSELFAWADFAVSAGGSTCWELCCLGVPMILVTFADNQAGITSGLHEAGAGWSLGWYEQVTEDDIAGAITALRTDGERRRQMGARASALVDGDGAARVAAVMQDMSDRQSTPLEAEVHRA